MKFSLLKFWSWVEILIILVLPSFFFLLLDIFKVRSSEMLPLKVWRDEECVNPSWDTPCFQCEYYRLWTIKLMEDYEWVQNLKWFKVKCWKFWLSFEGDWEVLRVFMLEKKRFVMIWCMNEWKLSYKTVSRVLYRYILMFVSIQASRFEACIEACSHVSVHE